MTRKVAMCRFSIIVPLLDSLNQFEDSLASVLRHRPNECQVIVVHDGSYSDPYHLSDEVQMVAADHESNLTGLLNIGMCYVAGEYTLIARPGVEIDENWQEPVLRAFDSRSTASVAPVLVSSYKPDRILTAGVSCERAFTRKHVGAGVNVSNRRAKALKPVGPSSWLAVYRTDLLKALAPFDESIDPMYLDLEVALSLRNLGFDSRLASEFVGTVDLDKSIEEESKRAHGNAAQRAIQRFNGIRSLSIIELLIELAQTPFASWKLKHLSQRFGAKRHQSTDLRFFRMLEQLKTSKPWNEKRIQSNTLQTSKGLRRAA